MKYVALATDAHPAYAAFAPLMVRFWHRLGYHSLLFIYEDLSTWQTPLGRLVRAELERLSIPHKRPMCTLIETPRIEPLSQANTMRVSRLAAAAVGTVYADDFVLTADMDMAPLSRTFFDLAPSQCYALRCDMYGSLEGACALWHDGQRRLVSGLFRFPLCYIGLPAHVWRTIMPLEVGDPIRSIRNINHGLRHDSHDHDEAATSARLLLSKWAAGALEPTVHAGGEVWRQGDLWLYPMTDWPKGQPKRMLLGGQARDHRPDAIDWHIKSKGLWIGEALAKYWPDDADYIREWWGKISPLQGAE